MRKVRGSQREGFCNGRSRISRELVPVFLACNSNTDVVAMELPLHWITPQSQLFHSKGKDHMICRHLEQTAPNAKFCFSLANVSSVALSAREIMLASSSAGSWFVGSSQSELAMEMGGSPHYGGECQSRGVLIRMSARRVN
jgi:hypothetical protein